MDADPNQTGILAFHSTLYKIDFKNDTNLISGRGNCVRGDIGQDYGCTVPTLNAEKPCSDRHLFTFDPTQSTTLP